MFYKRLYVTLFELLLVIGILSIVAGFLAVNVTKAWREQRYRTELSLIVDQLRLAQDLMIIFKSNVYVNFKGTPDGIEYKLVFDTPLPQNWLQEAKRPHDKLTAIQAINVVPDPKHSINAYAPNEGNNEENVYFLSGGSKMSKGYMRISTSETDSSLGSITRYICLPGYPAPIVTTVTHPLDDDCSEIDEAFMNNLTERTKNEILKD
jgi:Tfp pilus assembly protein FimT